MKCKKEEEVTIDIINGTGPLEFKLIFRLILKSCEELEEALLYPFLYTKPEALVTMTLRKMFSFS